MTSGSSCPTINALAGGEVSCHPGMVGGRLLSFPRFHRGVVRHWRGRSSHDLLLHGWKALLLLIPPWARQIRARPIGGRSPLPGAPASTAAENINSENRQGGCAHGRRVRRADRIFVILRVLRTSERYFCPFCFTAATKFAMLGDIYNGSVGEL